MRFGSPLEMKVERFDAHGRGVGLAKDPTDPRGKPIKAAAPFVVPGERITGVFEGRRKGEARFGQVVVQEASPDRVKPECPHAGVCGGCAWQHVRYGRQLEEKLAEARETLKASVEPSRLEAAPAVARFHHRNRMDFVFGPGGELGLKEQGRWDRHVDLSTCLLLSEDGAEVLRRVRAWSKTSGLLPWDNRTHRGDLRYLVVREGKNTGERMATLVTHGDALPKERELVEALTPLCTTIYHGVNPELTDLSIASRLRLLRGNDVLRERVAGTTYRIHPNAFFQTNTGMAEVLLGHVRDLVLSGPHARVLDLYCGGGFFALALAREAESVLGVELEPLAIGAAKAAAVENGVTNAEFRAEPAEKLSWEAERPDVTIVDPPRTGLHPSVLRTLLAHRPPRIIYVSCGVRTLARDLVMLRQAYDVADARCFDLFPHTPHVETVVHLIKRPV